MKWYVLIIALLLIGVLGVVFISYEEVNTNEDAVSNLKTMMLQPGTAHEVCMILTLDDELRYVFYVVGSLDFDLHYHLGGKVFYVIDQHTASRVKKTFRPTFSNDYCFMWVNNHAGPISFKFGYEKITKTDGP